MQNKPCTFLVITVFLLTQTIFSTGNETNFSPISIPQEKNLPLLSQLIDDSNSQAFQTFTSEQRTPLPQQKEDWLKNYYFDKNLFLGKIPLNQIFSNKIDPTHCPYLLIRNLIQKTSALDGHLLAQSQTFDQLIELFFKTRAIPGVEISVHPAIEQAIIIKCQDLLQKGNTANQAAIEIAINFFDAYASNSETPQYYSISKPSKCPSKATSNQCWDRDLYPDLQMLTQIQEYLEQEGCSPKAPITAFCYNKNRTAIGVGTSSGEVYFINIITKQILSLNVYKTYTYQVQTVFFDTQEKTLFVTNQDGVIQAWDLQTGTQTLFTSTKAKENFWHIPNKQRTAILIESSKPGTPCFICSIKKLSSGDRILIDSMKDIQSTTVTPSLFQRWNNLTNNALPNLAWGPNSPRFNQIAILNNPKI